MAIFSERQKQLIKRDEHVLKVARNILLERGYYALTMENLADESGCRRGTLYGRFTSKEDVVVALAAKSMQRRLELMKRGAEFSGRARERMQAVGEGLSLFVRLYGEDSSIIHTATGVIRERASPERLLALSHEEAQQFGLVDSVLRAAVAESDLVLESEDVLQEFVIGIWGLVEGAFSLIELGSPQAFGTTRPIYRVWRVFNRLADAYGWQPLFCEFDYEGSLASIRKACFSEETALAYGDGKWYGDEGDLDRI